MPLLPGNPYILSVDPMETPGEGTPQNMEGPKDYIQPYRVITRVHGLSHNAVASAPTLPILDSIYITPGGKEWDLLAVLVDKKARVQDREDDTNWIVDCHYSTRIKQSRQSDPNSQNNPELERPTVGWTYESIQYAPFRDRYGRPYQTASKMPFSPAVSHPLSYPVLRIGRKEPTYDVIRGMAYSNAINREPFLGFPRGCVQCLPPSAEQAWKGNWRYWHLGYQLRFSPIVPKVLETKLILPAGLTVEDFLPSIPEKFAGKWASLYGVTTLEMENYRFLGWQPLYLNQSLYRLKDVPAGFVGRPVQGVGEPTPILKGPVPISHPDLLDDQGQPVKKDPVTGVREPWFIGFVEYRYLSMNKLVVQGLGG